VICSGISATLPVLTNPITSSQGTEPYQVIMAILPSPTLIGEGRAFGRPSRLIGLALRTRRTIHSIVVAGGPLARGRDPRVGLGHPRAAAPALPVSVDARHKAGQEIPLQAESSECI
jgi:hypothetical protein